MVWAVVLPLNYTVAQPTLNNLLKMLKTTSSEYFMARELVDLSNVIIFVSLVLHVVFDWVMDR